MITVSPAQADIELGVGQVSTTTSFLLTNTYNVPVELSVELKGIDEESGRIIPSGEVDSHLASALHLSKTSLVLAEGASVNVDVEVQNQKELSAGGHYATLVFTQQKVGDQTVSVREAVSVGLFIVKRGGQLRQLDLTSYKLLSYPLQIPARADIEIKNSGNVHLIPRASVMVYDSKNNLVAKGVANEDSRRLLPGKALQDFARVRQVRHLWLPQKLRVELQYRADGIEEQQTVIKQIYYVPLYLLLVAAGVIVTIIVIIRFVRRRKARRKKITPSTQPVALEAATEDTVTVSKPVRRPSKKKKSTKKTKKSTQKPTESSIEPQAE